MERKSLDHWDLWSEILYQNTKKQKLHCEFSFVKMLWTRFSNLTRDVVVITTAQLHSKKFELWFKLEQRFKSCSRRVRDSWWWGFLTMVPAGNKAKRLSPVNHTKKQFIIIIIIIIIIFIITQRSLWATL